MQIVCKRCKHAWEYKGKATRVSCSKCRTSITLPPISKHEIPKQVHDVSKEVHISQGPYSKEEKAEIKRILDGESEKRKEKPIKETDFGLIAGGAEEMEVLKKMPITKVVYMPVNMARSIQFERTISWAMANGQDNIVFKVNNEGILAFS